MVSVIARVRLGANRVGYFDELTRIHLSIQRPEANITSAMNTKNIKRAVHEKVLHLVAGSLGDVSPEIPAVFRKKVEEKRKLEEKQVQKTEEKIEAKEKVEEVTTSEAIVEEVSEPPIAEAKETEDSGTIELTQETVNQEDKPRRTRRKKVTEETTE